MWAKQIIEGAKQKSKIVKVIAPRPLSLNRTPDHDRVKWGLKQNLTVENPNGCDIIIDIVFYVSR
jgi:hypothetical protein